jgi:hypothetical protein
VSQKPQAVQSCNGAAAAHRREINHHRLTALRIFASDRLGKEGL